MRLYMYLSLVVYEAVYGGSAGEVSTFRVEMRSDAF